MLATSTLVALEGCWPCSATYWMGIDVATMGAAASYLLSSLCQEFITVDQFDDTTWSLSVELIGFIAQLDQVLDESPKLEDIIEDGVNFDDVVNEDFKKDFDGEPQILIPESELIDLRDAVYGGLIRSIGADAPEKLQREYDRRSAEGTLKVNQDGDT